jgi:hypothetical protein
MSLHPYGSPYDPSRERPRCRNRREEDRLVLAATAVGVLIGVLLAVLVWLAVFAA